MALLDHQNDSSDVELLLRQASTDLDKNADIDMENSSRVRLADELSNERLVTSSPTNKYVRMRSFGEVTSDISTDRGFQLKMSSDVTKSSRNKKKFLEIECKDEGGSVDDGNMYSYANFLRSRTCYDCIPNSSKIVVVDAKLKVKKAYFALVHNSIRSAPVWDSSVQEFVGMLTITDFISQLIRYYKSPQEKMWELEEHKIETWRSLFSKSLPNVLLSISPTASVFAAVEILVKNRIHRLPVIDPDTGNVMFILTHKKVLRFIFNHIDDLAMPDFLGCTLQQLGIGSYKNVLKIKPSTTVIEALRIFDAHCVSALPIVDEHMKCIDIYSKFDVINLAAERTYNNLDLSVEEALLYRREGFEGVHKCQPTETLYVIIDRIATARVHRLVVVDANNRLIGVISLSDILRFIVINPPKDVIVT